MILDVGCGWWPQGFGVDIDRDSLASLIASGECLPFRNNSFETTVSNHTMEHTDHPDLFLKELMRVSSGKVVLTVPYRNLYVLFKTVKDHKWSFNKTWFRQTLKHFPHRIVYNGVRWPYWWPKQLKIWIYQTHRYNPPDKKFHLKKWLKNI